MGSTMERKLVDAILDCRTQRGIDKLAARLTEAE